MDIINDDELSRLLLQEIPPMMRAIRRIADRVENRSLTLPQFRVLNQIARQSCTSKQLAECHHVSVPSMSRMINMLAARKLLVRRPDKEDRRQMTLSLSKKGDQELNRVKKQVRAKLAERIRTLSLENKQTLAKGLAILQELSRDK